MGCQDESHCYLLRLWPPPALILWDWEGTKLAEYDKTAALALTTLPAPNSLLAYTYADHEWLLFQGWNWSLADIKTWIQNHEGETLDVGAIYTTTDGQNHNSWGNPRVDGADAICVHKRADTTMGEVALQNYFPLRAISIPDGTLSIGTNALWGCKTLRHLNIPNGITTISGGLIRQDNSLQKVIIPNSVTTIGFGAIQECFSFKKLIIPDSVRSIEGNAFSACYSLKDLVMSKNLSGRISGIFNNCYSLPKFHINSNITVIGPNTFANCKSMCDILLESKPILENVSAFSGLPSNYRIYVPRANLSWFETATNWSTIYTQGNLVAIENYTSYLESIGFNVDAYKTAA